MASCQKQDLKLNNYMTEDDYITIKNLTSEMSQLNNFSRYLEKVFKIKDNQRLQELLVDVNSLYWNNRGIVSGILKKLVGDMHEKFALGNRYFKARAESLQDYLPQNLFSDINLPEIVVDYYSDENELRPDFEDISLGITETIPGNVTFRGGKGSSWIPPSTEIPCSTIKSFELGDTYELCREDKFTVEVSNIPKRVLNKTEIHAHSFNVFRPRSVKLQRFGKKSDSLWRINTKGVLINEYQEKTISIKHSSTAYPVDFCHIDIPKDIGRHYKFHKEQNPHIFNGLFRKVFRKITFASGQDRGKLLKVQKAVVGSSYSLGVYGKNPIENTITFSDNKKVTGIGYQIHTEGISFQLSDEKFADISAKTKNTLKRNFVRHHVISKLTKEHSYFTIEKFADVMLTTIAKAKKETKDVHFYVKGSSFRKDLRETMAGVYFLSEEQKSIEKILKDDKVVNTFIESYVDIYNGRELYKEYLEDTFIHTLKHVLKKSGQILAGVETREYISGYTKLNMDFGELSQREIWLYELGVGGVGVIRDVQKILRENPNLFWHTTEKIIRYCPTEQDDLFLLNILKLPTETLCKLHDTVTAINTVTGAQNLQTTIKKLVTHVEESTKSVLTPHQVKLLLKLLSDNFNHRSAKIVNWKLYKEVNQRYIPYLETLLGYQPTSHEIKGFYHIIIDNPQYPELNKLYRLYKSEFTDDAEKIFKNNVKKRHLYNCRHSCPSCIDEGASCQIDHPGLSHLTLSRALLKEMFQQWGDFRIIELSQDDNIGQATKKISAIFAEHPHDFVAVKTHSLQKMALAKLISYLSDYGVDLNYRRVYPQIVEITYEEKYLYVWIQLGENV